MTLSALCRLYGVETEYRDMEGRLRRPAPDSILKVLQALGAQAGRLRDVPQAVRFRREQMRGLPGRAFAKPGRSWGLFLPLHALYSGRSRGAGDLTDLGSLAQWAGRQGARWIGTLPLLPTFLDRPFDPSPYAPVSRLFWSEFWVDLTRVPEWKRSASARRSSPGSPRRRWVDYRGLMRAKRRALEAMSRTMLSGGGARLRHFRRFLHENPRVEEYARFRAAQEGKDSALYHAYAQWQAQEQMDTLVRTARESGVWLALDLPLGVHPSGYDAWKYRDLFAQGISVGAPPDPFFTRGQNWGFAPLHPERIRREKYRYFTECIRHQMRAAGLLRIDHVMGLRRLFWIPSGFPAAEGVYVRYPAEEMAEVLCRESRRHRCEVVGEDLGTVPPEVRSMMRRKGLRRMFVFQFEFHSGRKPSFPDPSPDSVAFLNTHDMAPFEKFRRSLKKGPPVDEALAALAAGPAKILMVSLEDLWSERVPQNRPGMGPGRRNWSRRARFPLERFVRMPRVLETLREIDDLRKR